MTEPLISVVIPCGPRHVEHVRTAAASCRRLTVGPVETIVVADGGADVGALPGVWHLDTGGVRRGPAHARNLGVAVARAPFVLFLDADDYLLPHGPEMLLRRYAQGDVGYVYGDAYTIEPSGEAVLRRAPDYAQSHVGRYNLHAVTALYPTALVRELGGFDERVDIWEDWTLPLRAAIGGHCADRVGYPVFVYRVYEGDRMTRAFQTPLGVEAQQAVIKLYQNTEGVIAMRSCCGGRSQEAQVARVSVADLPVQNPMQVAGGMVRVEFTGEQRGAIPYRLPSGRTVALGNNPADRYADVEPGDAAWLLERVAVRVLPAHDQPDAPPPLSPILRAADVLTPGTPDQAAVAL